jgi:phosphate transport system substrate-binding protein
MIRWMAAARRAVVSGAPACALVGAPALALALAAAPAHATESPSSSPSVVQAAGATFPAKVYARWAEQYGRDQGVQVRYQPTGSGDGIRRASEHSVDFGGTDSPLPPDELARRRLVQIPMLVGGVVPVINLPGTSRLKLTGELLADLMAGRIERWDDARIAGLNPGAALPPRRILRVVRAEKSGTTEGFTRYLAGQSEAFKASPGVSSLPKWPGEAKAEEGNDGVVAAVKASAGAIGYISFDRVESSGLTPVTLLNRDGQWVLPSEAGFRAAILQSGVHRAGDDTASILDMPGADSWPITLISFVLVDAAPPQATRVEPALRFLYWCFQRGDALTRGTGFAPLPTSVQARLAARFASVRPAAGAKPAYQAF